MERVITNILDALRNGDVAPEQLDRIIRARSKEAGDGRRVFAKKRILPFYLNVRENDPARWRSWNVDEALDERFVATLRMKPRRTASGVATITVITKPWPCGGRCLYCPNDVRMPKSYLHDEPACQRAERNWFDPFLQVASRLHTLEQMGHPTDKVELIVLGGTWDDYPPEYRIWFARELFRALNAPKNDRRASVEARAERYSAIGIANDTAAIETATNQTQLLVDQGELTFNQAFERLYGESSPWESAGRWQQADLIDLEREQDENELSEHRVVGLVVETRPETVTPQTLAALRRMGCTKIQMGVQSLDENVLAANGRHANAIDVERALSLARLFGFKTHAHFMVNLMGATPASDVSDYRRFVSDARFVPDEVKLYPCALVAGTGLAQHFESGSWVPYSEEELISVLVSDMLATPPFCRVSRMIRDISAHDIIAGNKKTNLRQLVDERLAPRAGDVNEIRFREISTDAVDIDALQLDVVSYETSTTSERFIQWVTPHNRIAGFLRLSLPHGDAIDHLSGDLPVNRGEAMIREVHVYGTAARIHAEGTAAQHHGLGRQLIDRACEIARAAGFDRINVISAVGTRAYYRKLGFRDNGLYQQKTL